MELTEANIRQRIVALEQQRQELIRQAEQNIAAVGGAIAALQGLLSPEEQPAGEPEKGTADGRD